MRTIIIKNKQKKVNKKHPNKIIGMELIKPYIQMVSLKYQSKRKFFHKIQWT